MYIFLYIISPQFHFIWLSGIAFPFTDGPRTAVPVNLIAFIDYSRLAQALPFNVFIV